MATRRNHTSPGGRVIISVVLGLLVLAGARIVQIGVQNWQQAEAAVRWSAVPGTITKSELTTSQERIRPGEQRDGQRRGTYFHAEIQYEYSVAGETYRGTNVAAVNEMLAYATSDAAQKTIVKYPLGSRVNVYYHPSDPQVSLLEPGNAGGAPVQIAVGAVFLLVGGGFLSYIWASARRSKTS
ncbi:MAG: DUF3592 domain-containing protein [Planctomycetales bacterium]|nr:DUF3592 domain-containing protein [Planctomycetales bacterium]